jgi:pimeloyl-ACP methyl ester carboxylesterase/DNA-binding CsgD family transcriptional regulator
MDAPPIRYTTSADGTKIAYWVLGDGPAAIVHLPYPSSHLRNEWELPEIASWYERLAAGRTLIAYDSRGMGLSARGQGASLARGGVDDLEAVLDAAGVQRVAMLAMWGRGWTAIRFAARFPERVSHLVLWATATRGADLYTSTVAATSEIGTVDRDQADQVVLHSFMGWSAGDAPQRFIDAVLPALQRPRGAAAMGLLDAIRAVDVTDLAAGLDVPTLVLHARESRFVSEETASKLAASIPGARLVLLDGESLALPFGVADQALAAVDSFMQAPAAPRASAAVPDAEATPGAAAGPPYPDGLSAREVEVLRLVAMGASNPEIAEKLVISINTVTSHITSIYRKTETNNRVEATRYAIERRLTE